jgi:hypothetical protein
MVRSQTETLSQINISQKRAGGVAQGVGPEFKPQNHKKKKKKKKEKVRPVDSILRRGWGDK